MASLHETITPVANKLKTTYGQSQGHMSSYDAHLDDFQKQVENTVTRRFEILCNLYLEQIKFYGNVAESSIDSQQEFLQKMGLKIESKKEFQSMADVWNDIASNLYSYYTSNLEIILDTLHKNMKMTNMNIHGFTEMFQSYYSWWIPPNHNS
jgi:hypothetical protein